MSGMVFRPGEGEKVGGGPSTVIIKASGETTNGSLYLGEAVIAPGFPGPPPHTHETVHDFFYVLEGTLTLFLDGETVDLGPGSFACAQPGTVHTFSNSSDAPVRFLNFNTPGGWENYMRDLAQLLSRDTPPTQAEIGSVASNYDFKVAT